jgi:peptidoglycan/xylan/chitin deacetylase (PgdA/CDA1 family)/glycosyltransferase involved in cell wall biosynthesis
MGSVELSVIIPTFNRVERLRTCLEALTRQTQPMSDFEVIVIVDGSTDETMTMLAGFDPPYRLHYVWQENSGQGAALNRGIAEASGRFCLFLDDDIVAAPALVAEHLRAQRSTPSIVAIGQLGITLPAEADWYERAFAEGWQNRYESLNQGIGSLTWEDCYSGNLSVPREMLVACGGIATDLARGLDVELGYRLVKAGGVLVYIPGAAGCQAERKGFPELSRDAENAGFTDVALYQRDAAMLSQALGSFSGEGWRKLLLRRLLLALRVPPRWLAACGRLIRTPRRQRSWYAFVQNLCYWRGVRRAAAGTELWLRLTSGTPILLFHAIGAQTEQAGIFVMPRDRFAAQLAWIERLGYRAIGLDEFVGCLVDRRPPPARSVVVTFDDGYADTYTYAVPMLRRHRVPATVFLVSRSVGGANRWDEAGELAGRPLMSWTQVREMTEHGIRFGAHSRTHPNLTSVCSAEGTAEIAGSREDLERELGQPVSFFAYPFGLHDPAVQELVRRAGFTAGCTVDAGLNNLTTPLTALHRTEIRGTDSVVRLWLALWLGNPEAIWRRRRVPKQSV